MKTKFKKSESNFGCYVNQNNIQDTYLPNENFTINDVLNSDVKLKDKVWFIRKNCELTVLENQQFAIGCALIVISIYEEKYCENKAPRKAVEFAQYYLDGKISSDGLEKVRNYATAAYAADADAAYITHVAHATYAADPAAAYVAAVADAAAAAHAARAARAANVPYAAYAADTAYADAAYHAAHAATHASTADKKYEILLLQYFKDFTSNK